MSELTASERAVGEGARKQGGHLLRRTLVIALLLVSGGLIANGVLEFFFRFRESIDNISTLQGEMAQGAAFKIQQFVQDLETTLWAATQSRDIVSHGLTEAYRFELIKLFKIAPAITEVAAVDASGRERIKMSRTELSKDLEDRSADVAFVRARGGQAFFGPVYFVRQSEPHMRIAVPIERFAGEVIGVLIAEVNLKYIWDVVSQIKVGKTGYAYVVSREGDLIAHPDISLVLQKRNLKKLGQVTAALSEVKGPLPAHPNLAGERVFAAYANIPTLGWNVLVERPVKEAYEPLYASILRTSILLMVGLAMAVLASVLIARRVLRPVETLRQGAARIGAGELDQRIDVHTGDEIEALADEFNHMAARLQDSYSNLEQKVEERTHELSEALEQQTATSEILRVMSSSPNDLQPVLSAVAENAARLCEGSDALVYRLEGEVIRQVASYGITPGLAESDMPLRPTIVASRTVRDQQTIQIRYDSPEFAQEFPDSVSYFERFGIKTLLATPMIREGVALGAIVVRRKEAVPFAENHIALLKTFADVAVIAIENVRLFQEVQSQELNRLKRYLSPQIAEAILNREDDNLLKTHRREITVVFLDLRGFTAFSDVSEPEEVMDLLRTYQEEMGKLIFQFEGTLEGFWGDGMMIFFNDPIPCEDHTERAVRMALKMRSRGRELRAEWLKQGYDLDLGVGLAAGFATLGNIGFEGRMDYAAVGNVTNLAARLCGEAKGGEILVDQKTARKIEAVFEVEPLEELTLKGFTRPVASFNVLGLKHQPK